MSVQLTLGYISPRRGIRRSKIRFSGAVSRVRDEEPATNTGGSLLGVLHEGDEVMRLLKLIRRLARGQFWNPKRRCWKGGW
jgi:hypothetical protein